MKRLMLACCFLCWTVTVAQAQKVYMENSKFVIECTGMPAGSYTREPKSNKTDATATSRGSNTLDNLGSDINNEKVAYKFEVAATDEASANWNTAFGNCATRSGGGWRLPTQRELVLIWLQYEKLKALSMGSFDPYGYWAATEYSFNSGWIVDFDTAPPFYVTVNFRSVVYKVRCVRDM